MKQPFGGGSKFCGRQVADVPGIPERLASEMKQRAYVEKNDAHERMRAHKQSCPVCKSRLRVVPHQ